MKSVRGLAASLAAIVSLAACGGGEPAPDPVTEAPVATPAKPALTLTELPAPYSEANLDNGAMEYAKCRACHSVKADDGHLVGPNLHGMFDRAPGKAAKFRYSEALSGFQRDVWTPQDLDQWLEKPSEFLPGSSMFFNGMKDETARRDLIGWLMIEASK